MCILARQTSLPLVNTIFFLKALHTVGFVSWFAGLFFLVRLFVNHVEADERPEAERDTLHREYIGMEWRVYRIITNPAMMITWLAGLGMIVTNYIQTQQFGYFISGTPGWLHLKLLLLVLLTVYHVYCKRLIAQMQAGERPFTAWQFRLWNEVPTLLLVAISFIAVYGKGGQLNYLYLVLGLAAFAWLVYRGAVAYRRRRTGGQGDKGQGDGRRGGREE